jgi:tRNA (guanine-N7-)-methyltransferase
MAEPDEVEYELGVPIPGAILPPEQWARTAIKKLPAEGPLDWQATFGRRAPVVLDLGCGNGRFVLASALARADFDHVGLDILPVVIRYATRRANQRGLTNVRFAVCGGGDFLEKYVAPGTVEEIHVYHPQPYGDAQKIGRRMVTPAFLASVHRCLTPGGLFVIQTDNPAYWRYTAAVIPRFFDFHEQQGPWPDAREGRTRREIMARRMGLTIFRAWGRPRAELDAAALETLVAELPAPAFDAESGKRARRPLRGRKRRK